MESSKHRSHGYAALLAAVLTSAACTVVDDDGAADNAAIKATSGLAQMNDVSVLYPLPKTQAELDRGYLSPLAKARGGDLLPYDVVAASGMVETSPPGPVQIGQDTEMAWRDLRVVAFRIDPCFAHIGKIEHASQCQNQLRLIFQDMVADGKVHGVVDGAVHAFYTLTRAELVELVKAMIAIREEVGAEPLGPLAVHPLLVSQGVTGKAGTKMNALVLKYAGAANLTRFTVFAPTTGATAWSFSGFDVTKAGPAPMSIPTLPNGAIEVSFFSGFLPGTLNGNFTPATTHEDDISLLGKIADAKEAGIAKTKAAVDAALRIENPNRHSPDTIDCASCHVAGPGISLAALEFGIALDGNPNAYALTSGYLSAKDLVQTTPVRPHDDGTVRNFHAFSYRDATPMISRRVINETASVVDYLDSEVLKPKK